MGTVLRVNRVWKVFAPPGTSVDVEDPDSLQAAEAAGGVVAVRDVSLMLEPGEFFVVMGLSGSGKSTFIRSLLRLIEPTAGEIYFDGQDVRGLSRRELTAFRREKASMVFQHYGLLPHRTVLENAAFGLKLQGMGKQERLDRAEQALAQVGLQDWLHHYPAQLSGGMQQRVGIARALAKNPTLLLMDEPFSGLDPLIKREMQDEILRLQEEWQCTILFVTHDLDEAVRLGDRMAVMRAGEFVQVGPPDDILTNPADRYVAQFVNGAQTRARARVPRSVAGAVPGVVPEAVREAVQGALHGVVPEAVPEAVRGALHGVVPEAVPEAAQGAVHGVVPEAVRGVPRNRAAGHEGDTTPPPAGEAAQGAVSEAVPEAVRGVPEAVRGIHRNRAAGHAGDTTPPPAGEAAQSLAQTVGDDHEPGRGGHPTARGRRVEEAGVRRV